MRRGRRHITVAACIVAVAFLASSPAATEGAGINVAPSLSLEGTHDSNIFGTPDNETSDYVFRVKPGLALYLEIFQNTVKVSGGFEIERYVDHDELDDETATSSFGLSIEDPIRISPRFSIMPSATFVETSDSTRRNQLTLAPTPGIPPSETVVTSRSKVREYRGYLGIVYLLSPILDLSLGGGASRREFVENLPGENEEDSTTFTGDMSLLYRIRPRLSTGVFFNASRNSFDISPDSTTYGGGISARYSLTRFYTLLARGGVSHVRESADETGMRKEEWAPYGSLSLDYTRQYFKAELIGSFELAGGGSFGRTTERGNVQLSLTDQFMERWWWDMFLSFQTNRSIDDRDTVNVYTGDASAGIRYAATEWASIRLRGHIVRQDSSGLEGDDLDRETLYLGVDLSKTYKLY